MVKADNLVFEYILRDEEGNISGINKALDEVTLDIHPGQFIAILGHNGCGKSTFARHINALLAPTSGTIYVDNKDASKAENILDIRQVAGMVFQNPDNQIIGSVVEEDVAFGPENMGVNVDEMWERVLDSLSKVGMQAYRKSSPNKLSGGQKQRVAIAGTLAMKPKCIVLDEPTAMLDPIGRSEVIDVITKLNKQENVTIILITHYLEEIENADVVFVMSEGKIVMQGTPGQIFARQDELREYKLEVPQTAILSKMLYDGGVINRKTVMNTEELVEVIAKAFEIKQDI